MKHIFFFLLITTAAIGQRDTTFTDELKAYAAIDTTASGSNRYIKISFKLPSNYRTSDTDTINVTVKTVNTYIDSLLTLARADSTSAVIDVENFFLAYKRRNTTLENIRAYMTKLWAIKP